MVSELSLPKAVFDANNELLWICPVSSVQELIMVHAANDDDDNNAPMTRQVSKQGLFLLLSTQSMMKFKAIINMIHHYCT